jgi:hypothetical protein
LLMEGYGLLQGHAQGLSKSERRPRDIAGPARRSKEASLVRPSRRG